MLVLYARVLCRGAYMYMLRGCVGATYPGVHCGGSDGTDPHIMRHAGASGLQLHDPGGSIAFAVVAIARPAPSVSKTAVNLTIVCFSFRGQ